MYFVDVFSSLRDLPINTPFFLSGIIFNTRFSPKGQFWASKFMLIWLEYSLLDQSLFLFLYLTDVLKFAFSWRRYLPLQNGSFSDANFNISRKYFGDANFNISRRYFGKLSNSLFLSVFYFFVSVFNWTCSFTTLCILSAMAFYKFMALLKSNKFSVHPGTVRTIIVVSLSFIINYNWIVSYITQISNYFLFLIWCAVSSWIT